MMFAAVAAVVAAYFMLRIVALLRADTRRQAAAFDIYRIRAAFADEPVAIEARPSWPARQTPTDLARAYDGTVGPPPPLRPEHVAQHGSQVPAEPVPAEPVPAARVSTGEWAEIVRRVTDARAAELAAVAT